MSIRHGSKAVNVLRRHGEYHSLHPSLRNSLAQQKSETVIYKQR